MTISNFLIEKLLNDCFYIKIQFSLLMLYITIDLFIYQMFLYLQINELSK